MSTLEEKMRQEVRILFDTLCDGLRQEVRQRSLAHLTTGQDFSIANEREIGIASLLALHLRSLGFAVQLDAYIAGKDPRRRPDFGILLPASNKYIYLELKQTAWGNSYKGYYFAGAIKDMEKLNNKDIYPQYQGNGLIAIGFTNLEFENRRPHRLWNGFKELSQKITTEYPAYDEIGLKCIDLQDMDEQTSQAVIGLWFRKISTITPAPARATEVQR
ncbi:hypothetical protein ACFLV2_01075 [Chloroflexota bacterium]